MHIHFKGVHYETTGNQVFGKRKHALPCNANEHHPNTVNHNGLATVTEMEHEALQKTIIIGIIKSLYTRQLLTQKQMEQAIKDCAEKKKPPIK